MNTKQNLLVVGDYNRKDFLDLFKTCKNDFNFFFIEYAALKEVKTEHHKEYGQILFWKDFSDAFDLLARIKPAKVVFFFIEAYNHVALNVACKEKGIPTYHLEHGVRDYRRSALIEKTGRIHHEVSLLQKVFKGFSDTRVKVKTRMFFWKTARKAKREGRDFLQHFFKVRSKHTIFETFEIIKSPFRIADNYISFSPNIYKAHQIADHLTEEQKVCFTGIPSFDEWANIQSAVTPVKAVLFIDQAFVKQSLLGWTKAFHDEFVEKLAEKCFQSGYKLFVKIHPLEDANAWEQAQEKGRLKIVIDNEEFKSLASNVAVVMGFYSTLLMPLAAMPNVTLFTLECHPVQDVFPSKFLVESGVSHAVYDLDDLSSVLENIERYQQEQSRNKEQFVKSWLYKFDGNAGKRLREVLVDGQCP